jgi:CelD/BcsL family acetyltransferase involved in cellulose biosynthesis
MLSVTKYASFADLRDEWNSLLGEANARGPFLIWEWQRLWWQTFAGDEDLWLLAVREGDAVIGIAPLALSDGKVGFACGSDVSDFLDIVVRREREEAVAEAVISYLGEQDWRELDLCCMHPEAAALRYFPSLLHRQGLRVETPRLDTSPVVDLPGDWDAFQAALSKKDRHELRRKYRRLTSEATVSTYVLVGSEIGPREVDDFLTLHRLSTPDKAAFMDERMEGYFREVFRRFAGDGYIRLYLMEVDGRRVSAALCFDPGDEILLYNSGYDPAYSRLSVGLLLKAFCVQDAVALGRRRFDFLRGDERYKYDLGGTDVPIHGLHVERRS